MNSPYQSIVAGMRIYLVGYMGSGKTKLGREVAAQLGYEFIDLDEVFEEKYHISIADFFAKYNEETFRLLEHNLLMQTVARENCVISTGGGTPCYFDNMDFITSNGISFYIRVSSQLLVRRLLNVRVKRPVLKDIPNDRMEDFVRNQVAEREKYYLRASFVVEGQDVSAGTIEHLIRQVPPVS
jgi:shikimate kinase